MKKLSFVLLLTLISLSLAFAQGGKEAETKKYVFAQDCTWPPLEYVDENGKITGFEVELIAECARLSGVEMVSQNTAWDGIFAGLVNGAYDCIASGVTVTEERKATMEFTNPILVVNQSIMVRTDEPALKTIADLDGKKVGVQMGTTGDFVLDGHDKIEKKGYDEIPLAVQDLLNGKVDAVVCDSLIASDFVLANKNYSGRLTVSGSASDEVENIAMATKKGNTELVNLLNDCFAKLEKNGTMAELKKKYNIL